MVTLRSCKAGKQDGSPCGSPPMHDGEFCYMHDPEHAQEMQEARRLGGLRRRTEATVSVAYDFRGLRTVDDIWRFLELAGIDTLRLENSVNRNRTMGALAQLAMKLLGVGEHEDRIRALEGALGPRLLKEKRQ